MLPARPQQISRREWCTVLALTALILLAVALPYVLAYGVPPDHVFAGALFNPMDGQSYLAKMREGWRGDWLFTLPYTADPGPGTFIFVYYLVLGHLARLLNVPLDGIYQWARVLTSGFLLVSAYHFFARFFESARARLGVWLLFALGSGLGWLAVPFGAVTSDFWVAEAFPFLSVLSNSHFCLAAGLMLWIFEWTLVAEPGDGQHAGALRRLGFTALAVTALAIVQPMTLAVVGVVVAAVKALEGLSQSRQNGWPLPRLLRWRGWLPVLAVAVFAAPWVLYDFVVTLTQPQVAGWNAQDVTPSPPAWNALLSGGLPLALACAGVAALCWPRTGTQLRRRRPEMVAAALWLGLNVLLIYAPLSVQRRLALGIWTPIVILAGFAWQHLLWPRLQQRWKPLVVTGAVLLVLPSNLLVYAAVFSAIPKQAPEVFLTEDEAATLNWLGGQAQGQVVLASPGFSEFVPARTDERVVYGHPHETVMATAHRQAVEDFFAGRILLGAFEAQYRVDYVVYGPREEALGPKPPLPGWHTVFQVGAVAVYGR